MSTPEKIIVTEATIECRMCPTVVVGKTADRWTVYARYRWGRLVVRLDYCFPPNLGGAAGKWIYDKLLDPQELEGFINYDELRELTSEFVVWPAELTPKTYNDNDGACLDDLLN